MFIKLFKKINLYYYILIINIVLFIGAIGCEYYFFNIAQYCFIFKYWYLFMMFNIVLFYYYSYKKYYGFEDKLAITPQYTLPKQKSLLQTCYALGYYTNYQSLSAAILELVHLGYIELIQEPTSYIPMLYRKRKDTVYLTSDQKYIMNELLFSFLDTYKMYLSRDKKSKNLTQALLDLDNILEDWKTNKKFVIRDMYKIRDEFASKVRILLFMYIFTNILLMVKVDYIWSFLFINFFIFIFGIIAVFIATNFLKFIYHVILFLILLIFGIWDLSSEGISIYDFLNPSYYPIYTWQFTAILGVYVMWSFRGLGQRGAYLKKHILGYKLFKKTVTRESNPLELEYNEEELYALHYNTKRMSAKILSEYFYLVLVKEENPKKMDVIR